MSTPQLDLMPRECRIALGKRARVRRWTSLYVGAAALACSVWWGVELGQSDLRSKRTFLAEGVHARWMRNEQVQRLLKEIAGVESAITRYNRLALPVRASEALDVVSAVVPHGVTLNSLLLSVREEKVTAHDTKRDRRTQSPPPANAAPAIPEAPPEPERFLGIEMEGIARGDADVSALVSGLESSPLISQVQLDYARSDEFEGTPVRGFRLTCRIDLSRRYTFVTEASSEGRAGVADESGASE